MATVCRSFLLLSITSVLFAHISGSPSKKTFLDVTRPHFVTRSADAELHDAVAAALGDGHGIGHGRLSSMRRALQPMWESLPKIDQGRVDHRMLRYAVHRYFLHTHGLAIVGLEPVHGNGSHSEVKLLAEAALSYVKGTLEGRSARDGFSIEEAVGMIATLERLVQDTASELLETAYQITGNDINSDVNRADMMNILEKYMLRWMMGDDLEGVEMFEANQTMLTESFAHWDKILQFVDGRLKSFEYIWQFQPHRPHGLRAEFSFTDAETVANGITMSFGRYWETECNNVKNSLLELDRDNTGRAKLSDFYSTALGGEWRFSESKEYLRELGALDESSDYHGPRVIIPNYLQGSSNCIIFASHYRVCCANDCEDFLSELERAVGSPLATPGQILPLVMNMTTTLDDDVPNLEDLAAQLLQIAKMHDGKIPLHGRLFTQWMHYVFPRECAFPHMAGTVSHITPSEFGENFYATGHEMESHVSDLTKPKPEPIDELEKEWMSQWSDEEELLSDHALLQAPWDAKQTGGVIVLLLGASLIVAVWTNLKSFTDGRTVGGALFSAESNSHLI